MATDFHRYLPSPTVPGPWGFDLRAGGRGFIASYQPYPPHGHPCGYDFAWSDGRVLGQYALVLVSQGGGIVIDHRRQTHPVVAGQCFLVVPGRWHSYAPHQHSGWEEQWLVFDGPAARRLLDGELASQAVHDADAGLAAAVGAALALLEQQPPGFLAEAEACLARALARLVAGRAAVAEDRQHGSALRRAAVRLQEGPACITTLARECGLSPACFRRRFQEATGHTPRDYAVLVRLERAKELLAMPGATVALVAERAGFCSASFFSRLFTRHCGCPPSAWQGRRR
jgi:AraC-like DNA-binding protein